MGFKNKRNQKALQVIPNTVTVKKRNQQLMTKFTVNEIMHEGNCENVYNKIWESWET